MKFVYPNGATPYNQDDQAALIPKHITTQQQLNEWEQDKTWKWAGDFRKHNTNIGVSYPHIQECLANLLADVAYWVEGGTFPLDEIATRFHARLVFIHPFSNGNGRHARLLTDAFLKSMDAQRFTWRRISLSNQSDVRTQYIDALKKADSGDFVSLLDFVRS